jgi:hypothetical protein
MIKPGTVANICNLSDLVGTTPQDVESLSGRHEALGSIPSTTNN